MKRIAALILTLLLLTGGMASRASASGMPLCAYIPKSASALHPASITYDPTGHYSGSVYYRNLREVSLSGDQRLDLVNIALSQVGYHEGNSVSQLDGSNKSGTGNYTEYGYWYGTRVLEQNSGFFYEWCAMFIAWSARQARIPKSIINNASYAHAGSNPYYFNVTFHPRGTYTPKTGDLVFFDWFATERNWDHVGIVAYVENNRVYTVEGNASDQVIMRQFSIHSYEIQGWGVPAYATSATNALSISNYSVPNRTLSCGSTGNDVRWLQAALLHLGYPTPVDGYFGANTQRQLKKFQSYKGLASDGVCGPNVRTAIKNALSSGGYSGASDPSAYPVPIRTLREGSTGNDVRWLQAALNKLGASLSIDGSFGPGTKAKVVWAQQKYGLTPDGVCGPATRARIISALGSSGGGGGGSNYPVPTRTLREGMSGSDVKWLQSALKKAGYSMSVTGYFGSQTKENLKAFQRSRGLSADGVCGPATRAKLKVIAGGYPVPTRTLKKGCTGNDVKWLQSALTELGYTLTADGSFGSSTRAKVIAFQLDNGLVPDGICGPATRAAILGKQ